MANIQPQDQRINTNLQIVDYTPNTNAAISTGAFRAQQEIAANTRKIDRANKAMAEFKAKAEEKQLTKETIAYIGKLGQSKDSTTQQVMNSLAVNTEDPAEVRNFIKVAGGPSAAMKLINESADSIRTFQQDLQKEAAKQAGKADGPAVLLEPGTSSDYAKEKNYSSISTKPYVAPDGKVYDEVTSTTAGPTEEVTKIELPDWALKEDGKVNTEAVQKVDSDEDGIPELIQFVAQNSDGEYYIKSNEFDPTKDPVTAADIEYEKAFSKNMAESDVEALKEYRDNRIQREKNIAAYKSVLDGLLSGTVTPRNIIEFIPNWGGLRDSARTVFKPKNQDAIDTVADVVMQSLKEVLGGAFSEKEGQRLMDAAYNAGLTAEQNAVRIGRAMMVLEIAQREQEKMYNYYQENGTLKGYDIMPIDVVRGTIRDFEEAMHKEDVKLARDNPNNEDLQRALLGENPVIKVSD